MDGGAMELNCTPPTGPIEVDNDVVGPGILAAFFVSATITIAAVIFAYLSGCVDNELVNELDQRVISIVQSKFQSIWSALRDGKASVADAPVSKSEDIARQVRKDALTMFILALSDQQLVTGLAILVAGVTAQSRLTGYEFTVILSFAWFSSTTHLATLDVLSKYFASRGIIRDVRVVGMAVVLCVLTYTLVVAILLVPNIRIPVQCAFTAPSTSAAPPDPLAFIFTVLPLYSTYLTRIMGLYFRQPIGYYVSLIRWKLRHRRKLPRSWLNQRFGDLTAFDRRKRLERIGASSGVQRKILAALLRYDHSFLSGLPDIAFSFSYGVAQLVQSRWQSVPDQGLSADASKMGFGQITAIFLLILPFLAAGEAYYEYRIKRIGQADEDGTPLRLNNEITDKMADNLVEGDVLLRRHSTYSNNIDLSRGNINDEAGNPPIMSYYPKDVRRASAREVAVVSRREKLEIQRQKKLIAARTKVLKRVEEEVDVQFPLWIFLVQLSISIAIGILLNEGGAETSAVAAALFIGSSLIRVSGSVADGIKFLRFRDDQLDTFGFAESRRWTL